MSESDTTVKPLRVSPSIKAVRWALLIYGILHGSWKLNALRDFEEREHKIREQRIKEKYELLAKETHIKTVGEVKELAKDLGVTEFPPNWDEGI